MNQTRTALWLRNSYMRVSIPGGKVAAVCVKRLLKDKVEVAVVAHSCNPSTWAAEAG